MANANKYFPTDNDLYGAQYDILFSSIKDNPFLPESAIPVLNKALETDNKQIIKAVNEILELTDVIDGKMKSLMETYNEFIGNPNLDLEDVAEIKKIDTTLTKSVIKIAKDINGEDLENPIDISSIGSSVKDSIVKLSKNITYFDSCLFKNNWKLNEDDNYYEYIFYSALIPANTVVNIIPNIQSLDDEEAICFAGILPNVSLTKDEFDHDSYLIKARNQPTQDINIFIYLMKNVSEEKENM